MAKRTNKPVQNSIHRFADDGEWWCEECGKKVEANNYGVEIREFPVAFCSDCAREIGNKLLEISKGI